MKLTQRLILIMAASACLLAAQDDPPGRIARLSYTYGSVSFRPGDADDWFAANVTRPLTTGDHVYVDFAGTAELQIGSGALRLGSKTTMDILNLDDSNVQLRLSEGTLVIRVRTLGDQDSFEVDTPNLAFSLLRTGEYRIDVKPDSATTLVMVRGGDGELTGPDQALTVHAGEQVQVTGADQPNYQTFGAPPRDTLDNFAAQRDQREDQSEAGRYCSREMVGYQDLDKYGSWRNTPDNGMVWVPNGTPAGWAPYHYGHWAWVDPWGWTWVDDAPWGFAPSHYGRWAYTGGFWGWVPGPIAQRPVYAPALVAWVGGGAVGGGVAWFPLGPREVYVPSYHTSTAYVNRVNVSNTVIVNNIVNVNITNVTYVNRTAPGAVMAVQHDAFVSAKPVQSAAITVRPDAIRSAPVVATAAVAPTRASLARAPESGARVAQPAAAIVNRPVIAKKTPPPPPVPFAQKQAALAANAGRPLDVSQVQQLRAKQPPPAQPPVRQVQARTPSPASKAAPAVQANRPGAQAPPQRTPPPTPATPAPAARPAAPPTPATPAPAARPAAPPTPATPTPAPTAARPAEQRRSEAPAQPAKEPAPAPQRTATPPPSSASPQAKSPAPPATKPAPKEDKGNKAKKAEKDKKDEKDK
jgi:hypothetical protein